MAEKFRETFSNPYVDDAVYDARFSSIIAMDEAHERWHSSSWRADKVNFDLDISAISMDDMQPSNTKGLEENRFSFDLKRDIIEADEDSDRLDGISYDASYRPQGVLSTNISNISIDRLRYNALADVQEDIPEDLTYLYGGGSGKSSQKKRASFRKRSRQADEAVNKERRARLEKVMAPYEKTTSLDDIMKDVRHHREVEEAKSGKIHSPKIGRERQGFYEIYREPGTMEDFSDALDEYLRDEVNEYGSWRNSIPEQAGLVPDTQTMPRFGRFSRTWSAMDKLEPSRREILMHTVNTIYDDDDPKKNSKEGVHSRFKSRNHVNREYYVADNDFDPYDMYRPLSQPRPVRSAQGGNIFETEVREDRYNNPYAVVSNDRIREMLDNDMHGPGNLAAPEGITDPSLMYEWNMGYGRVNPGENEYAGWIKQQSELAQNAEQSRYRGSHRTGRPGAYIQRERPYGPDRRYPRGEYRDRTTQRRDMEQQLRNATQKGIEDGRDIIRRQQKEERKRYMEYCARQQEMYKKQQEQMMKQQQAYYDRLKSQGQPQQSNNVQKPQFGQWGYYTRPVPNNVNPTAAAQNPASNKKS